MADPILLAPSPEGRVLPTLNADGSRRWIRPKPSPGVWWRRRRAVAWALMAIFLVVPYLRMNGRPLVLLDLPRRRFDQREHLLAFVDAVPHVVEREQRLRDDQHLVPEVGVLAKVRRRLALHQDAFRARPLEQLLSTRPTNVQIQTGPPSASLTSFIPCPTASRPWLRTLRARRPSNRSSRPCG